MVLVMLEDVLKADRKLFILKNGKNKKQQKNGENPKKHIYVDNR